MGARQEELGLNWKRETERDSQCELNASSVKKEKKHFNFRNSKRIHFTKGKLSSLPSPFPT